MILRRMRHCVIGNVLDREEGTVSMARRVRQAAGESRKAVWLSLYTQRGFASGSVYFTVSVFCDVWVYTAIPWRVRAGEGRQLIIGKLWI